MTRFICENVSRCSKLIGDVRIKCEYLLHGIKMSKMHEVPPVNPDDAKLKFLCKKVEADGVIGFIEDEDYLTYCKADNHINCPVFKDKLIYKP